MPNQLNVSLAEVLGLVVLAATMAFCGGIYLGHTWGTRQVAAVQGGAG